MKESNEEWRTRIFASIKWHRWFAWHPVRITGAWSYRWLTYVGRKRGISLHSKNPMEDIIILQDVHYCLDEDVVMFALSDETIIDPESIISEYGNLLRPTVLSRNMSKIQMPTVRPPAPNAPPRVIHKEKQHGTK